MVVSEVNVWVSSDSDTQEHAMDTTIYPGSGFWALVQQYSDPRVKECPMGITTVEIGSVW
jgi:hypothetical protein